MVFRVTTWFEMKQADYAKFSLQVDLKKTASRYTHYVGKQIILLFGLLVLTFWVAVFAIAEGVYEISMKDLLGVLTGRISGHAATVIWSLRLPRVVAAMVCGVGLSLAGLGVQSVLKNPLGSPSTLGISQGAGFAAAASIVFFRAQVVSVAMFAFLGSVSAAVVILLLTKARRLSPETVVLVGVLLSALFSSATTLIQFFADEMQLSMVVFWTFGDVARSSWSEIGIAAGVVLPMSLLIAYLRWDLNVLSSGEECAQGLGVNVETLRILVLGAVALVAAVVTAFHGVIAFVGLVAPHMAGRLVGKAQALLMPFTSVLGALLLLSADTLGRMLIGSGALPVGVVTSFLGAPLFFYLLMRRMR